MSKAINKYGETNFTIKILDQTGDPKEALEIESKYIKKLKTLVPKGYNLVEYGSGNTPGLKRSDECKKRMSIDRLKDWQNPEYRKITSDAIKKTWDNPKRKAKQKIISKKLWEDPEYRKSTSKAIKKSWDDLERKKEHSKIMKKTSIENNWSEKRRKKMATLKNDPNWKRKQKKGVIKSFKTLDRLPQMKKISEKTWAKSPERKKYFLIE